MTPTVRPRATEHIGEIIHLVKDLVDSGHAYVARNGDVYLDIVIHGGAAGIHLHMVRRMGLEFFLFMGRGIV